MLTWSQTLWISTHVREQMCVTRCRLLSNLDVTVLKFDAADSNCLIYSLSLRPGCRCLWTYMLGMQCNQDQRRPMLVNIVRILTD